MAPPLRAVTGATVLLLALAACSGGADETVDAVAPADQLATAKKQLDETTGVTFTLTSENTPKGSAGVTGAKGLGAATPKPAFKGTINATVSGVTGTVDVIAVDQDVYMKFFTPSYAKIDPATYGAPNPAQLFSSTTGISTLLSGLVDPQAGDQAREGAEVLDTVSGTVPGDAVADLFVVGDREGVFDATMAMTQDGHQLRKATLTGPFFDGATSTYTLLLSDYGQQADIALP